MSTFEKSTVWVSLGVPRFVLGVTVTAGVRGCDEDVPHPLTVSRKSFSLLVDKPESKPAASVFPQLMLSDF